MVRVAAVRPADAGAKRISMVQLDPGDRDDPAAQVPPVSWKLELLRASLATAKLAVPVLDNVSCCTAFEPTTVGAKTTVDVETVAIGEPVGPGEAADVPSPPPPPPHPEKVLRAIPVANTTIVRTTYIRPLLLEPIRFS